MPISPYITTISFAIYLVCRLVGRRRVVRSSHEAPHLAAGGRAAGTRRHRGLRQRAGLHSSLETPGSAIGLATVYRALDDLANEGEADSLQQEGECLYRACTPGTHHHHLICRNCGMTVEIEADPVETWAQKVAAQHGFTQPHHIVDVFGYCPDCTKALA